MTHIEGHADWLAKLSELRAGHEGLPPKGETQAKAPGPRHGDLHLRLLDAAAVANDRANHEQVFYVRMLKERFAVDLLALLAEGAPESWQAVHFSCDCERYRTIVEYYQALLAKGTTEGQELAAELDDAAGPGGLHAFGALVWSRADALLETFMALLQQHTLNAPYLTGIRD